jgi:5,10-methylenetetrahydromethanopterin reductase
MKISIGIGDIAGKPVSMAELGVQAQRAEAAGFHGAWVANIFGADALTVLTVCGLSTQRIALGTAVIPTYPRHPYAMAQQAMTTNAAIGNRLTLGIGLSHQIVIENMFGMSYAKSYSHMKEYLAVLAPLIREGKVSYEGESYRVNAQVKVPGSAPCPILVAALAPKMLALAGTVADGTITWMTGPKTLEQHTIPTITAAAKVAERPAPRVVAGLPVAVHTDKEAARAAVAKQFRAYGMLPSYRAMLDREGGVGPEGVAIVGTESEVNAQLDHLAAVGVTELFAVPFSVVRDDDTAERTIEVLAQRAKRSAQ